MLNMAQIEKPLQIPGYQHIPELFDKTRRTFEEKVPLRASALEIGMFLNSFNTLAFSFLGASSCQAQILGMDPEGNQYRKWVKDTLMFMFLSPLKRLISADNQQ